MVRQISHQEPELIAVDGDPARVNEFRGSLEQRRADRDLLYRRRGEPGLDPNARWIAVCGGAVFFAETFEAIMADLERNSVDPRRCVVEPASPDNVLHEHANP